MLYYSRFCTAVMKGIFYMNFKTISNLLESKGQTHLLRFFDQLNDNERHILLSQITEIDWSFLDSLHKDKNSDSSEKIEAIDALTRSQISEKEEEYRTIGYDAIRSGKLCLLMLAGGQGTRLGFDKPKGCFNMGLNKQLYIFELLIAHTLDIVKKVDTWIPFYIMTSNINYTDTVTFFEEHDYFGYNPDYLHFFIQELNPATDFTGKILMQSPYELALSPNGNGGWFHSMYKSGHLDPILTSDIEWINVFSVDNVLQGIADPVFLGATIASGKMSGSKVVRKTCPEEKVGVMCKADGRPHIIEYYEMTDEMLHKKAADGSLAYGFGVTLNYLFPIHRLRETLHHKMPLHVVSKKVPCIDSNGTYMVPDEPNAYKFETLALDLIREMDDCLVFEIEREKEFAPVKNKEGVDSVDSARDLLMKNGYTL